MKRLNGQPMVEFQAVVNFVMPFADADTIIAKGTIAEQEQALADWLCSHPPDDVNHSTEIYHRSHTWDQFRKGLGESLVNRRTQELKLLAAPAPMPHPADIENL